MKNKLQIFNKKSLNQTIYLLLIIAIICSIFGFIYETIFYKIDLGYFIKRGSTFGPWIPIYGFGGLLITIIVYRYRKNPLLVFILSSLVSGILEYVTGYVLNVFFSTRLWDYNIEIWNFGNINGYICLRSVLFFGISSLFLIYFIIPFLQKIKIPETTLKIISLTVSIVFILDIILYHIINYGLPPL